MKLGILKSDQSPIVPLAPKAATKFKKLGVDVYMECGAGEAAFLADNEFENVHCVSRQDVITNAEVLVTKGIPSDLNFNELKGKYWIAEFQPFNDESIAGKLKDAGVKAFSLDMIPRISRAQSMDVLSSMANIAGYQAVLLGAEKLPRYFPMMMTAAGTVKPAKVLVIGAGVAGLQAIATARRLGAVVEAFDTRTAVKEEVESLGAKFVEVEGATDDKDAGGYAVEQSEDYKRRQQEKVREHSAAADVVVTTAQIRGRKAPLIIPEQTVNAMKPGSVIVDLAASTGGNAAYTKNNEIIKHNGVTIIGNSNLADTMPQTASEMYANNVYNFVELMVKDGALHVDLEDEILAGALITD